ncbi:MAG: adenylosuccinate lyase, partial [Deltaproteobacteria bacterium]
MIPRYSPAEFQALWSQKRKYEAWFDVEIAACHAMENAGVVPGGTADQVAGFREKLDPDA